MKDPAFLFYSDNFMSGTMFLSDEQVGKYIRLLCAQHLTGHLSENDMIFICKQYDDNIFKKFIKDNDGRYYNERLETEIMKRQNYSKSRSDNKLGKTKTDKKDKIISKSYDKHMGNENENVNEVKNGIEVSMDVLIFQKAVQWMKENSPSVLKLKEPFTEKQFTELRKDFTNDQIKHLLLKMHNWEPLTKKSKSANLTFRNWSKRETFKDMVIENKVDSNQYVKQEPNEYWAMLKPEYR